MRQFRQESCIGRSCWYHFTIQTCQLPMTFTSILPNIKWQTGKSSPTTSQINTNLKSSTWGVHWFPAVLTTYTNPNPSTQTSTKIPNPPQQQNQLKAVHLFTKKGTLAIGTDRNGDHPKENISLTQSHKQPTFTIHKIPAQEAHCITA